MSCSPDLITYLLRNFETMNPDFFDKNVGSGFFLQFTDKLFLKLLTHILAIRGLCCTEIAISELKMSLNQEL